MALSRSAAWTCAVTVLLVVAAGLSTTAPAILAADAADDGADRSIEGATRFRQEEFLRSDPVWVQRAVSDRAAFPDVSWGTPLTEDEAAEMNARVRFQKGADDAILAAASQDGYGGAMYDWEHGRRLVVFTTGDPDSVRNAVERHVPEGGSLRVEPVERSLDALIRTRDKVTDDWKELENEGITVIAASVDVVRNDVEIRVLERTEAAVDRLRRYGEAIRVTKETPTVADSCAPDNCSDVWGRIRAWFHDGDWTHYCTTGYNVMRTDLNPDKLAMLTAGHCIWQSDQGRWRYDNTHEFGTENANHGFHSGSFGDVGIISFDLADLPSPTNKYLANPASGTVNGVTGVMSFSSQSRSFRDVQQRRRELVHHGSLRAIRARAVSGHHDRAVHQLGVQLTMRRDGAGRAR